MKNQTKINLRRSSVRMFNPEKNETVVYDSTSRMSIPEAKEIAKARKMVFIDKTDTIDTFNVSNDDLIKLKNKAKE